MDESLVNAIHAAFPVGTPPPQPITCHRCAECDETDQLLGGRTWTDVARGFPVECLMTFPLLTAAAKLYYLPAYMCYEIQSPGSMPGISVLAALEQGDIPSELLTEAQRAAICAWEGLEEDA